ncbi:MAG: class I SAM-dependent methyltransferase [Catenulispora sp.]
MKPRPTRSTPPWEIARPQPALAALAEAGAFSGRVLDVGCGTGEHALLAAALGLEVTAIDVSRDALRSAERKAAERKLAVRFLKYDVLDLAALGEVFDTVLDSLVFHAIADRRAYVDGLRAVTRPGGRLFVLCYSDRHTGLPDVPHKTSAAAIESAFAEVDRRRDPAGRQRVEPAPGRGRGVAGDVYP